MPSKRIILLTRRPGADVSYPVVLWADVPAGNQVAYRNPTATSAYDNATPAELQAIRDGLVAEKVTSFIGSAGTAMTTAQAALQREWTDWQAQVTAEVSWSDFGRFWDSTGSTWTASPGVPMGRAREESGDELPTYVVLTPVSAFGVSKFHLVLANTASTMTAQGQIVKIRQVALIPGQVVVTGVVPSAWQLRRREAYTTAPAGGAFAIAAADFAQSVPPTITAHNAPTTAPAGGTTTLFNEIVPQSDEVKASTLDAPTMASLLGECGGQVIYQPQAGWKPITIRAGQTLEVQQTATAGTGNSRVLCVFTIG